MAQCALGPTSSIAKLMLTIVRGAKRGRWMYEEEGKDPDEVENNSVRTH